MPDYKKAVIYMLEPSIKYDEGDIYYGSTTQPLCKRFYTHKLTSNDCKSKLLFEKYGSENVKIIFIKCFPCENKQELDAEEAKYIRESKCVNHYIPGRSRKEYVEANKEQIKEYFDIYYKTNKKKIQEYKKEYRVDNKEKLIEKGKEYRENNKEKIRERKKEYYEQTKEKMKEKIKCECGCDVIKNYLKLHQTSKKHKKKY